MLKYLDGRKPYTLKTLILLKRLYLFYAVSYKSFVFYFGLFIFTWEIIFSSTYCLKLIKFQFPHIY